MSYRYILIFVLLYITQLFSQNENLIFERINTSNGLTNNNVRRVFQDSKGYLWVGTADGLNKYDGYNFMNFRYDPQDTTSISNNGIFSIYEDKHGDLWIGTEEGLNLYNRENNNFQSFKYSERTERWMNLVISIFEDKNGTLWMGTATRGLTKFDRQTKKFTHFPLDTSSGFATNANAVPFIIEDLNFPGQRLWVAGFTTGFYAFDIDKQKFTQYTHDPKDPSSLVNNNAFSLLQDYEGNIWIGTQGGLSKFNPDNEKFTNYKHSPNDPSTLSNDFILSLFEDPDKKGEIWIGTVNGLNILDTKTNLFTIHKSILNNPTTLSSNAMDAIYKDRSGVIWIGTNGGLDKIDRGRVPFRQYSRASEKENGLNSNQIFSISSSAADPNILWIATYGGGLNKFDRSNNSFTYFKRNPSNMYSISGDSVRAVFEDPDEAGEVLWVGTTRGLNRFDLKTNRFKKYNLSEKPGSISSNFIRQIYETRDGMLWITTSSGLNMFDRTKEIFRSYLLQDTTYVPAIQNLVLKLYENRKPIASILKVGEEANSTKTINLNEKTKTLVVSLGEGQDIMYDYGWLENSNGEIIWKFDFDKSRHAGGGQKNRMEIWRGTLDAGQYKLRYVSDIGHSYDNWNVSAPRNQHMWGIQAFKIDDSEDNIVKNNIQKFNKPKSIASGNTTAILEDSYGMLWIGTLDEGLSKLDRKTGEFTNFSLDPTKSGSLSDNNIFSLQEDKSGILWIGTQNGLNKFDRKTNSFTKYSVKDGLPNNSIISILEDDEGNLWLATNNGISKFDPQGEAKNGRVTFINYNIEDGLQYNNYYTGSMHKSAKGEMFFGGYNGFVSFFPGKNNPIPPKTIISDFRIFNESIKPGSDSPLTKHISEVESIKLSPSQNAFSFEFLALHFSRPEKNQYLYQMEGFDKNWIDGYRRYAPYTNLDPGDYIFKVKASNSDGVWNEHGADINITILPPWWRTTWAYIGYFVFFIALIAGIDRFQRRRLLAKTKERMKIKDAEHRAEAAELEARAAKAENERKSKELEEARNLQLSMLPKELPQLPHLDIAVYMQTATEVGGDYYDFHLSLDGTLTVVVGDATGHGMKAGTMVTTAKSLFNSYAPNPDILFSFQEITRCIKQMNFGKLSMCLTMLKIKGDKMQISTAGMPPSFIFRRDTRVVEEHLFKAMPLGTMEKFPYEIKDTTLNAGDTILLMSDGLPELENSKGEMYGYKRIRNGFEDVAEKPPEEIVSFLKNEGAGWVNNADPDDDVTFVVIKVK